MLYGRFKRRSINPSRVRRPSRLLLEYLEDRVVMTAPHDGQLLIPIYGSTDSTTSGVIGVDLFSRAQTPISMGGHFHNPVYVSEGTDGQVYVTDVGEVS